MFTQYVGVALDTLFVVAALLPTAMVVVYRWREVGRREQEIDAMMDAAFPDAANSDARERATKELLDRNPYISDPRVTFKNCHDWPRYAFPLVILFALTLSIAYIGRAWALMRLGIASTSSVPDLPDVIVMALAGGFVWSLFQIINRALAGELGPPDLYEINLGILAAVPIGYACSLLTLQADKLRVFAAFVASAFPVRESQLMLREYFARKILEATNARTLRPAERNLGTAIEGVSDETLARLGELHITTILDMAYCDPIRVMVQTGVPLPIIIDWMDQSLWALYAGDLKADFAKFGLRCSLDVCEFVDMHLRDRDGKKRDPLREIDQRLLKAIADKMGVDSGLVSDLFFRIYVDPQVQVLRQLWYPMGVPDDLH